MSPSLPCFLLDRIKVVTYLTYALLNTFSGPFPIQCTDAI